MEMETYIELSILKFRRPSHITHTLLTPSTTNSVRSLLEVDSVAVGTDSPGTRWNTDGGTQTVLNTGCHMFCSDCSEGGDSAEYVLKDAF